MVCEDRANDDSTKPHKAAGHVSTDKDLEGRTEGGSKGAMAKRADRESREEESEQSEEGECGGRASEGLKESGCRDVSGVPEWPFAVL